MDLEKSSGGEKTTLSTEVQPPAVQAAQATEQGSGGMKATLSTEVTEPMPPRGQHTTAVEKDDLIDADRCPGPTNMMFEVTDMLDRESDEAQEVDLRNENGHNNNNVNELMDCPDNNVYDDEQPESDKFNLDLTGKKNL